MAKNIYKEKQEPIPVVIHKANRAFTNSMQNRLSKNGYDITVEQWLILLLLYHRDGLFQQQLADTVGKNKGTISPQIDRLEQKNLVLRVPDKKDRRQNSIYLTNKGKALKEELIALGVENNEHSVLDIPMEELKCCMGVLRTICDNLATV